MSFLIDESEVEADITTQCIVVGAGACGLVAALALADAEIETLVLERDSQATGSTSLSSGFIPAVGTRRQRASNIDDSAALFAADIQAPVLDWLESAHAIEWVLLDDFLYPGHSAHRMHAVPEKTGVALQTKLLDAANRQGVDIVTRARVDALLVRRNKSAGSTDVCGVSIVRPDGAVEIIKASSVILACNGYGGNSELMQRFIPEMAQANYFGHCGNTGDAIIWGEQLGASLKHMGAYQGHGSVAYGHNILITWALMMEGGVQINLNNRVSSARGIYTINDCIRWG